MRAFSGLLQPALRALAVACVSVAAFVPPAHAGLFDDEEARKAILDLRQRIEQSAEQQRARQAEQATQFTEQNSQFKRGLLELNNQLEQLRAENAKLQGQNEQLAREVSQVQRQLKDLQSGVDDRIRKIEPAKVSLDGKEFTADPEETRFYQEALEALRKSEFERSAGLLNAFKKRYPSSGYTPSVLFWLGNAQYALRQYKDAMASFRTLVGSAPDHPKASEALLAIANCLTELKDNKSARRTLEELQKAYPKSEAAQAAKDRLASVR
jgi:tol-pal system protein YbgF